MGARCLGGFSSIIFSVRVAVGWVLAFGGVVTRLIYSTGF